MTDFAEYKRLPADERDNLGFARCRGDQLYIGINTAGFAGVFNAVRVVNGNTYCLMEVAEESVSIMSDLAIWKPFNPPTSAEGVEHG